VLSQLQCASLLANAFLCTFPSPNRVGGDLPYVNFFEVFEARERSFLPSFLLP